MHEPDSAPVRRPFRRALVALAAAASLVPVALTATATQAATVSQASVVSATPSRNTPDIADGTVYDIARVGARTVVGGTFTSVTSARATGAMTRNRLLSFDAAGVVDAGFAPDLDKAVNALLPGPTAGTVYVGGAFTTMNGVAVRKLLLLDVATGQQVKGFRAPVLDGMVNDVKRVGDRLYVGGTFTTAGGAAHAGIVTLSATTGAVDPFFDIQVAGNHNWGTPAAGTNGAKAPVGVSKLDVDPAGRTLVAIGNFKTVDGTDRDQVFLADLTGSTSEIADWQTDRYDPTCYSNAFDSWVRDVDFSPDGSYFVIASSGGYPGYNVLCDSAARWETAARGTQLQPTWVDWTGGDTLLSVAVTDAAVYVGGHQRWQNNAFASDRSGPGAVPRPGLAALDPNNGLPLAWNPGRNPRGVGAAALLVTDDGLYVGSDTNVIGTGSTRAVRGKIAFFPLAGGTPRVAQPAATLPTRVVQAAGPVRGNVLYRLNAGGPTVAAVDGGPAWLGDSAIDAYRSSGSNTASWSPLPNRGTIPASTPSAIFDSERWDPPGGDELTYALPVPTTVPITLRLFFANRCSCTSAVGARTMDVVVDGKPVLTNVDIVGRVGDQTAMSVELSLPAEADGTVDIAFLHRTENPLVNGIEVLDASAPAPPATRSSTVATRSFDGSTAGPVTTTTDGLSWADARGAFTVGSTLYYGWAADGSLRTRALLADGRLGPETRLDPYNGTVWEKVSAGRGMTYAGTPSGLAGSMAGVTSMMFAKGRLYYTVSGRPGLYARFFSPDSGVVGSEEFLADASRDWSGTSGLFLAGNRLYVALADGNLHAAGWTDSSAVTGQPVLGRTTGPLALVSGTGDWGGRAMWTTAG